MKPLLILIVILLIIGFFIRLRLGLRCWPWLILALFQPDPFFPLATVSFAADELDVEEIQPLEVHELPVEPDAVDCPMACPEVSGLVQSRSLTETD